MAQYKPKLNLPLRPFDILLESAAALAMAILIALPLLHWNSLPDIIPTHFDLRGKPDKFGGKASLWLLPVIGLVFWAGFTLLSRFPHVFNLPVKVTPENAARQYQLAIRLLRVVKFIVLAMFAQMVFTNIRAAKDSADNPLNLGIFFLIFHLPLLAAVVWYFAEAQKR